MVSSLEKEKAEQMAHVKRVKSKLREIKGDLFRKSEQPDRAESVRVSHLFRSHRLCSAAVVSMLQSSQ